MHVSDLIFPEQNHLVVREISVFLLSLFEQVHRGIKGVVKDTDGNGIKGATISVRGIRKDVTTGKYNIVWLHIFHLVLC